MSVGLRSRTPETLAAALGASSSCTLARHEPTHREGRGKAAALARHHGTLSLNGLLSGLAGPPHAAAWAREIAVRTAGVDAEF